MSVQRTLACLVIGLGLPLAPGLALELPETGLAYEIEVSLEPGERRLEGRETIRWTNPSATVSVERVPLHLYLNGFSHEDTTWMRTGIARGVSPRRQRARFGDPWGWIDPTSIRQAGIELGWSPVSPDDGNPFDRTLVEVILAEPVGPGETLVLEVDFEAKLPVPFARTGGHEDFFLVAQWFPKLAVFELAGIRGATQDGWNAHQFHGLTEFYADFADYDVRIGVPEGWAVAAAGRGGPGESADGTDRRWHHYRQRAVHDFAFAASSHLTGITFEYQPLGRERPVQIRLYLPGGTEGQVERWRPALEGSFDVLQSRVGPYPFSTLTAVFPPFRAKETRGMEYPAFFTGPYGDRYWDWPVVSGSRYPESTITHEFAHQYFHGILGSNEFEEAFLDEGFAEYWGLQVQIELYGDAAGYGTLLGRETGVTELVRIAQPDPESERLPIGTRPTYLAHGIDWGMQFYMRPAAVLMTAAGLFGQESVDRVFAAYYKRWAFRHPGLEDFIVVAREVGGESFASFIAESFEQTRSPDYRVESFKTRRWDEPDGHVGGAGSGAEPDSDPEGDNGRAGLDPAALETDGFLLVEILDPGFGRRGKGSIERRTVSPERLEPEEEWEAKENVFYLSELRVAGPAWENLPVEVDFRFADGVVFRETWDGRSPFRDYRFLRPAPLSEVRIDPDGRIVLDPDPANNGMLRQPDTGLVRDWSAWLGGLFHFLAEGVSLWL